jgi:hypothetical protein
MDLFRLDCEIDEMDKRDDLTELELDDMLELMYTRMELAQFLMQYDDNTCLVELN